ncbi:MAG: energy transducer TonB [Bacteroidota bacterium]
MEPALNSPQTEARRRAAAGRRLAARRPFVVRKQISRSAARRRIAARPSTPLTAPQRAFDPLHRTKRLVALVVAILGSLALHAAFVGIGSVMRDGLRTAARDEVKIEMRQRPPEPPPEKKPPVPEPEPEPRKKPAAPPPPKAKAPPPPVEAPKPVRVIGLSMESTTEGGSGPSFAVGNTRLGETAEKAVAPKDVTALPTGPDVPGPTGPAKTNRAAGRIPVAGVVYTQPKRKRSQQLVYPPTLKSQGIEGDVTVLLTLDETGKVTAVKILKETPYPEFTAAARATALLEEFEPATRDGVPMSYTFSFIYRFRLEDE